MAPISPDGLRDPARTLPGRESPLPVAPRHAVLEAPLAGPFPPGTALALFGMGCFWGAERMFWRLEGVVSTAVGYAGGQTPNPTYEEVCSGLTNHAEVVRVAYDPARIDYAELARTFWEGHDPTQGMRQGNDRGTQYRSVAHWYDDAQRATLEAGRAAFESRLMAAGFGPITTELAPAPVFYFAEDGHQQYLHKVPHGYCGLGGTGVSCPVGAGVATD